MINKELEIQLSGIVNEHKLKFSNSRSKETGLLAMKNNLSNAPDSSSELLDELLEKANEYIDKHNIEDTSEIEEIIKEHYSEFMKFCIVGE